MMIERILIIQDLKRFLFFYLLLLIPVLFLGIKYRAAFWKLFGSILFPLILGALFIYNILSYPTLNWFVIFPSYQGTFQRLPSNQLISLYDHGSAPARTAWIYSLVEIYYPGKTLSVPGEILSSLDLSPEQFKIQGRLVDVVVLEMDSELTSDQADLIRGMETAVIKLDDGNTYYFVREEKDPNSSLLLLKYRTELFFFPEDLLPEKEGNL